MFNSKFAKEIVKARIREEYTQQAVAEAISVSVRWYQQIESGEKRPSAIVMMRLLVLFNIDAELFREEVGIIVPIQPRKRRKRIDGAREV